MTAHIGAKHRWRDTVAAVIAAAIVALATFSGAGVQALSLVVLLALLIGFISRLIALRRDSIEVGLLREPRAAHLRHHRWQFAVRAAFLVAWMSALVPLAPLLALLGANLLSWGAFLAVLGCAWVALALVQTKLVPIATNIAFGLATVAIALGWAALWLPAPEAVTLSPPLQGDFVVGQGGDSPLLNLHWPLVQQRYALDVLALRDGRALVEDGSGDLLKDSVGFGATLISPAAGQVVKARDGLADDTNNFKKAAGNYVVIALPGEPQRYVMLAHMKNGSLLVKEGDEVKVGQPLGQLGNSGNSSMPHLHIQVQSKPQYNDEDSTTFPILLAGTQVSRDAQSWQATTRRLRRGDFVRAR